MTDDGQLALLKAARELLGAMQIDIAKQAGVHKQSVANYEQGKPVSPATVAHIERALRELNILAHTTPEYDLVIKSHKQLSDQDRTELIETVNQAFKNIHRRRSHALMKELGMENLTHLIPREQIGPIIPRQVITKSDFLTRYAKDEETGMDIVDDLHDAIRE